MLEDLTTPADGAPPTVRTSPGANAAWLLAGSLIAVISLAFGTIQVTGLLAHEERTERVTIGDPGMRVLDVASDSGSIEIVGADVTSVRISAHISDGMAATQFRHQVVGDRLEVRVRCRGPFSNPWCNARLRIVVPRGMEVKVRADDDHVTVRGLTGRVDAQSSNGTVEAEALSGQALLHSSNGSVRASRMRSTSIEADTDNGSVHLEFEVPPASAVARSSNGNVEVAVPRGDEAYAVDVHSNNGGTDNLVRTDSTSTRRIVASSDNGSVIVRYLD